MKTKIETTEQIDRWNVAVELTDHALGLAAVDVDNPRKLATLLSLAGRPQIRATLVQAGIPLGYFKPEEGQSLGPR